MLCRKEELEEKGLALIYDVLDNTGNLVGYDTFKRTFDIKNQLCRLLCINTLNNRIIWSAKTN